MDQTVRGFLLVATTSTAALIWEFLEFLMDRSMGTNIQVSLANTMQDQFLGMLGGLLAAIWTLAPVWRDRRDSFQGGNRLSGQP